MARTIRTPWTALFAVGFVILGSFPLFPAAAPAFALEAALGKALYISFLVLLAFGSITAAMLRDAARETEQKARDDATYARHEMLIQLIAGLRAQSGPETAQSALKLRALGLSADIMQFLAEHDSLPRHPEREGAIARHDEEALHRIFHEETAAMAHQHLYTTSLAKKRFSSRVGPIRNDLAEAGLRDEKLDKYIFEYGVENLHVLAMIAERIAKLAGRLPDNPPAL
jgi:hypothetical protein